MKYLKLFENFQDIDSLSKKYGIRNYTINNDGSVDVNGNVDLSYKRLPSIPIKFGKVGGDFDCIGNNLTSLEGFPMKVGGDFFCYSNELTSLEGCPNEVGGHFKCYNNKLTIIDYLPERIEGIIDFEYNKIRDIKVEDKNYRFFGKCLLKGNPINDLFRYWEGDLKNFILDLDLEDFIRDEGESVDILRFEYALNGKEYKEEDITNYKLIYKE